MDEGAASVRRFQMALAPGTPLRDGLDRIVHGRTGALIVLGTNKELTGLLTGGFTIDVEFTPTALRELAKMDGAIVLNTELNRILRAGVQLMPDPALPTVETGTRHRTADRVARQTGLACVTVSASMSTIALYLDGQRHALERPEQLLARANQAMQTLERYRARLLEATRHLSSQEVQASSTQRDVVVVFQRHEMVRRLVAEVEGYVAALGTDGRLLEMQLAEVVVGLDDLVELLTKDYGHIPDLSPAGLRDATSAELLDLGIVARALGIAAYLPDEHVAARGFRQLSQVSRLPASVAERLLDHFDGLQGLFGASTAELQAVEGVGETRARTVRDGLIRMAEAAYETTRYE